LLLSELGFWHSLELPAVDTERCVELEYYWFGHLM